MPKPVDSEASVPTPNENTPCRPNTSNSMLDGQDTDPHKLAVFKVHKAEDDSNGPAVDVIHVTALCPDQDLHGIETLLPNLKSKRTEFLFRVDMAELLVGDLTAVCIEQLAADLLEGLATPTAIEGGDSAQDANRGPTPVIVFVAYDLGAVVLKMALSLAAKYEEEYPGIFFRTPVIVFSGCPQRAADAHEMERNLFDLLRDKRHGAWYHRVTFPSVCSLAHSTLRTTELFNDSKITLRSRIVSIYADSTGKGQIHPAFGFFSGTLGLPSEIRIKEDGHDPIQFQELGTRIVFESDSWEIDPKWIPIERILLTLSAPQQQFGIRSPEPSPSCAAALASSTYTKWKTSPGVQLLYVHGHTSLTTHDTAEYVTITQQAYFRRQGYSGTRTYTFKFDSRDPLRDSFADMFASLLVQSMDNQDKWYRGLEYSRIHHQLLFHGGWTEGTCLSMLNYLRVNIFGPATTLLLQDLDECSKDSRALFLKYCREVSERSEYPLKILVTSRKPQNLLKELQHWSTIQVDDDTLLCANGEISRDILRFCPTENHRNEIQRRLGALKHMEITLRQRVLRLVTECAGWPTDPSTKSFSAFTQLLDISLRHDTPEGILDSILRSRNDDGGLRWPLHFLLCSFRPLSLSELTAILYYQNCKERETTSSWLTSPDWVSWQNLKGQLRDRLRGLVDIQESQIIFLPSIKDLLVAEDTNTHKYLWNEMKQTAHKTIAEFCINYLACEDNQASLRSAARLHVSKDSNSNEKCRDTVAPFTRMCGIDIVPYAIQALPYHLSKCPRTVVDTLRSHITSWVSEPFALWAKAHWEASNPFTRTVEKPESPLPILAGFGLVPYEEIEKEDDRCQNQCFVAAAGASLGGPVARFLADEKKNHAVPVLFDGLIAAVQAGDEALALKIVYKLMRIRVANSCAWPTSVIWAATHHNMVQLADVLLHEGASPDPQEEDYPASQAVASTPFTSPLYMASGHGYVDLVGTLIRHNAKKDVLRFGKFNSLHSAAKGGFPKVTQLLAKLPEYLESMKKGGPLYVSATCGNWKSVRVMLELDGNPNVKYNVDSYDWSALAAACDKGFTATVETLLEYGADPNTLGPYGVDTPLWFAAIRGRIPDCVRSLLRHGADPNHERLQPPLLAELAEKDDGSSVISICDALLANDPPIQINSHDRNSGETALMAASIYGNLPMVQWLLRNNADINMLDNEKRSALFFAVECGNAAVVEELLTRHPNVNVLDTKGTTLLYAALDNSAILKLLLEEGSDPDYGQRVLIQAICDSREDIVQMLIEKKADVISPDAEGWPPIYYAVAVSESANIVRLLAENGAILNGKANGYGILHFAINAPLDVLKVLLEFAKIIDIVRGGCEEQTPLLSAGPKANIECLKLLIRTGADINAIDKHGETALHNAVRMKMAPFRSLLLSQPNVDIEAQGGVWGRPLHFACVGVDMDGVVALLDRGADVNVKIPDIFASTPLVATLIGGSSRAEDAVKVDQVARILVQRGADVRDTMRGSVFYTALSAACLGSGVSTIQFLLDEGASADQADPITCRLPMHYAAINGIENLEAILLAYRGDIMAADIGGRNALHFAAQHGNAKAVEFILARMENQPVKQGRYVNLVDIDGWSPLCWAARPFREQSYCAKMKSEKADFAETVRTLLRHGADRLVECRLGVGHAVEMLTPLELAQRSDAGQDIINMLKYDADSPHSNVNQALEEGGHNSTKLFTSWSTTCDVCFAPILGAVYHCTDCPDWDACSKCYANIHLYHDAKTKDDGKQHALELKTDRPNYRDVPKSHASGSVEGDEVEDKAKSSTGTEERETSVDETELELDFADGIED